MRTTAALLLISLSAGPAFAQTTWFVDAGAVGPGTGSSADPYVSLQAAIAAASTAPGDTLLIAAGTYSETIDLLGKDLVLDGSGAAAKPVVDGGGMGSALTFTSGETPACVLRGLEITGGTGTDVAGVTVGGAARILGASPTFEDVVLRGNRAGLGGALHVSGGGARLVDCELMENEAGNGGGIRVLGADVELVDCRLELNTAGVSPFGGGYGGAVSVGLDGALDVRSCTFERNTCFGFNLEGGGAIHQESTARACTALDSAFLFNGQGTGSNGIQGGAILALGDFEGRDCDFRFNGDIFNQVVFGGACVGGSYVECTFERNFGTSGGALADGTATECLFENNFAEFKGGATSGAQLNGCVLRYNTAGAFGGAVAHGCVERSLVELNSASPLDSNPTDGGGAWMADVSDSVLRANLCFGSGAGAHGGTLERCVLEYNRGEFQSSAPEGGGASRATLRDCVLRGNVVDGGPDSRGGGAFACVMERCVVIGNRASLGGGAADRTVPPLSLSSVNCTFIQNRADLEGGGVRSGTHRNALVYGNHGGASGALAAFSYSDVAGGAPGIGNFDLDPLLFAPSGADVHLLAASPCIDAGDPTLLDPDGSRSDVGALPFDPGWTTGTGPFCTATRRASEECVVMLDSPGAASLTSGATVRATGLEPGRTAIAFAGTEPAYGVLSPVFGSDLIACVGGNIVRFPVVTTSGSSDPCSGELVQTIPAPTLAALGLVPGDRLLVQVWARGSFVSRPLHTHGLDLLVVP